MNVFMSTKRGAARGKITKVDRASPWGDGVQDHPFLRNKRLGWGCWLGRRELDGWFRENTASVGEPNRIAVGTGVSRSFRGRRRKKDDHAKTAWHSMRPPPLWSATGLSCLGSTRHDSTRLDSKQCDAAVVICRKSGSSESLVEHPPWLAGVGKARGDRLINNQPQQEAQSAARVRREDTREVREG